MATQGRNEGFHVLDGFVCEAIHAPSVPLASPTNQGQNEGMSVVEELVFDAGREATSDKTVQPNSRRPSLPAGPEAALKAAIEPLTAYISASSNPRGALAHALELLFAKVTGVEQAAAEVLEKLRHVGDASESRVNNPAESNATTDGCRDPGSS